LTGLSRPFTPFVRFDFRCSVVQEETRDEHHSLLGHAGFGDHLPGDGVFGNGSFTEDHFFVTDMNIFQIEPGGAYQPIEELPALDDLQQNSAC